MASRAVSAFSYKCFMNPSFSVLGSPGSISYIVLKLINCKKLKKIYMTCRVKSVVGHSISAKEKLCSLSYTFHVVK